MFVWGKNDLNPEQEKAIYNENSILLTKVSHPLKH